MLYTRSLMTWEDQTYPLDSSFNFGLGGGFYRTLPAWLPDPCYICGVDLLAESSGLPYPPGTSGILIILHDRKGRYRALETIADSVPSGDIVAGEWLQRLVVLDIQGGSTRRTRQAHTPPVRFSRSEGDLLLCNFPGSAPPPGNTFRIWPCWSIVYLVDDTLRPPPDRAFGIGSWLFPIKNPGGRSINNSGADRANAGFGFVAPAAGEISSVRLRICLVRAQGKIKVQLYSDLNGSPGTAIGLPSKPWLIDAAGAHEPYFNIGCGALVQAGLPYWLVISLVGAKTLDADIDTCGYQPAYKSGRRDSIAAITQNLPDNDTYRMLVTAIATV